MKSGIRKSAPSLRWIIIAALLDAALSAVAVAFLIFGAGVLPPGGSRFLYFPISSVLGGMALLSFFLTAYILRQACVANRMRHSVDHALLASEERYKLLVDSLPQVVFEIDGKGNFSFVNQHALDLWGITQEDMGRGVNAIHMLIPEDRERAMENMRRVLDGDSLGNVEYSALRKNGEIVPIMIRSNRVMRDGKPAGLRGIAADVSEQKAAQAEKTEFEQRRQQTHKLETIGALAGGIAHDFNNILAAIIGYADLAKGELSPEDDLYYHLEQILKAGERAKSLVKQILLFSRQGGQERHPLHLVPLIKEVMKFLRATLPATIDIQIRLLTEQDVILADATQIHQVIMNLGTNAAHAMAGRGGVVEVFLTEEPVASAFLEEHPDVKDGKVVRLRVRDTGVGIPSEIMGRIFDPFFSTKERGEGTGLGLSVVHGIIRSHRGSIGVTSRVGEGTTVDVLFPVYEGEAGRQQESAVPLPRGSERILFVDDEEVLVPLCDAMLKKLGYEATSVSSSMEALALFERDPDAFDVIITDLTMPDLTGIELSERITKTRQDIPVILCTGFGEQMDREMLRTVGIVELIFKPPLIEDMAWAIRRALESEPEKKDVPWPTC